ncbi:uncharacterized protein LOC117552875 [Gymnodraco acuticeps]|uniref:Uncharacterized protein LOC117552875 n=1 Tax=Gymnodraco acuticeps TaxID=8218 RepID=A0A6P8V556_GYMAC|nr:uncharacterized protein LOC117552875 [Gymnodraco acuticeps]
MATASEKQAQPTLTFEGWRYSHYFELVDNKGKNVSVRCTLCPGQKLLSTAVNSTANLIKHLRGKHASMKLVAQDPRRNEDISSPSPKQLKLQFLLSKQELDKLVASFIVEEMLPINTVESPTFRKILSKIPITGDRRPWSDRKTFTGYLDECYLKMESELKKTFESLPYLSTTADIWSSHNRSFLGITVHWINPCNFKREKAAIACKRIKGRHTYDVIGFEMEQIHSAFGLSHRITATVTDNGSNFVKAFKMYAPPEPNEEEDNDEQGVVFTDVEELLGAKEGQFSLPPHFRCASHTLNLISCNDIDKWLSSNSDSKCVYRSATAKCAALWTKASRSTLASEIVDEICGKKMIVPTSTRWNSFHDALSRISDIPAQDLNTLCTRLDIRAPTEREHLFLKEYCSVLKPLTVALDILQGEDNCYYGTLLPTLETLMSRTLALQNGLSRMTANLPGVIVQAIRTRFAPVLESSEALLAALTLPKFKVRWIVGAERREAARALLIAECRTLPRDEEPANNKNREAAAHSSANENDFFSFDEEEEDAMSISADSEVFEYMRSGSELEVLNRFPRVKAVCMKYNTATPSSAPVERLFSLGGIVLSPRRNRLSDKRFERLLLMRYNRTFCTDVE